MLTLKERMAQLSPERRAKIEARTNKLRRGYLLLRSLREKLNLTQRETVQKKGCVFKRNN
jgi:hypothetical protein